MIKDQSNFDETERKLMANAISSNPNDFRFNLRRLNLALDNKSNKNINDSLEIIYQEIWNKRGNISQENFDRIINDIKNIRATIDGQEPQSVKVDERQKRINQMAEMIVDMVDCKDPMTRFKTNAHVKTWDDLEWWAKKGLEQYAGMKARFDLDGDQDNLEDFIIGKMGVFDELVKNISQIKSLVK